MRFINKLLNRDRAAAQEEAQRAEEERRKKAEHRVSVAAKELRNAGPWSKKTAAFEVGSINVVAIVFDSSYGHRGQRVQVQLRADGLMKGKLIESGTDAQDQEFIVPDAQRTETLRSLLSAAEQNDLPKLEGKSATQRFLAQARHTAVHEFVLEHLNKSLAVDEDMRPEH